MRTCKKSIGLGILLLAVCFYLPATVQGAPVELVAYWPFDTDGTNVQGNTAFDAAVNVQAGEEDAVSFSGENVMVGTGALRIDDDTTGKHNLWVSNSPFQAIKTQFTLVCWANMTDIGDNGWDARIFVCETEEYEVSIGGRDTGEVGEWYLRGTPGWSDVDGPLNAADAWHHYALVYDAVNGVGQFYFDGQLRDNLTGTPGPGLMDTTRFVIGDYRAGDGGRNFDGYIDDMAVFSGILTAEEIASLASGSSALILASSKLDMDKDSINVNEDGPTSESYTVKLVREPNQPTVTVTATRNNGQVTVNGGDSVVLNFTNTNWDTAQTITIAAVDDNVQEGNHFSEIKYTLASDDSFYTGLTRSMSVNIVDNDTPGVTIIETGDSTDVAEGGATDSFSVVLDGEPNNGSGTGTVEVTVSVNDPFDETTVDAGSSVTLTFTQAAGAKQWNIPQAVSVAAVDDSDNEGDHAGKISFTISGGDDDAGYDDLVVDDLWCNITDNDATQTLIGQWEFDSTNVNVSARTVNDSSTTDADYAGALFYDSDVQVPTLFNKAGTDYHYLDFTGDTDPNQAVGIYDINANWHYLPQQNITLEAWVAPDDITADDEVIIGCKQDNGAYERGWLLGMDASNKFAAALKTTDSADYGGYLLSNSSYQVGQWHLVTATYDGSSLKLYVDGILENEQAKTGGIDYADAAFVLATNYDDDQAWEYDGRIQEVRMYNYALDATTIMNNYLTMPPGSMATITEEGGSTSVSEFGSTSDTYQIVLDTAIVADANVVIDVIPDSDLDVGAGAGVTITLTFTSSNWDTAQTVTVTAVDDDELEGDGIALIRHNISSADDPDYDRSGVRNVYVSVGDDDCGLWGYSPMDFNQDCQVDLYDYAKFAMAWANCTQPFMPGCQHDFTEGLVAYWSFDEDFTANDPTYDAVPTNGPSIVPGGKLGGAASFDRSQSQYARSSASPITQSSYTYSAWYYLDVADITGSDRYFVLEAQNYPASFGFRESGGDIAQVYVHTVSAAPNMSFPTGGNQTWHHIVVTYDASTGLSTAYLDGSLVNSMPTSGALYASTYLVIGGHQAGTGRNWNGLIDEVYVWNRVLDADYVTELWNNGNGLKPF
ncbi:MAG: LamG domain-containing protein [Sedimentisphaerales bacterium]|nr:LamG domain-containing protein [Sedimentisphaerales bacterium]